jgi:dihydroflavonol-4-reductase
MDDPILVTGASGFIGRALVASLSPRKNRVRALVRRPEAAHALAALGAEPIIGDLLTPGSAEKACRGVRSVYHLAGRLFTPGSDPDEYTRLHVDATLALLGSVASASHGLECFVLCSTTGIHGPTGSDPVKEDHDGNPQNAYERTKAEAERRATQFAQQNGVPLVIARPGLVYGPGDRHLLGWFRAVQGGYYRVIGPGDNHFHPIYIDDLIRGLRLCGERGAKAGRTYHLVGSTPLTVRELSDAIGRAVGRPVPRLHLPTPLAYTIGAAFEALPAPRQRLPLTRSRVRFLTQNRAYDGARACEELGFVPHIGLDEGLERTVAWYRHQGLLR